MPDKPLTAPAAKGIREPLGGLLRRPALFFDPMSLSAKHWRRLIGQAPVVSACIQTLIMQITGLEWTITSENDDQTAVDEFTTIVNMADNGGGFESLVARVIEDTLTVPFGGAIELGPYPDGQVAWLAHLDGALMSPTYDEKYPFMQSNPYDPLRPAVFKATEVARIMWQPQAATSLYGWTKTPCMACLPAIQGLLRSDRFWQTLLTDSPPAGILDIPGMTEDEARDWLSDWKTMMAGIDSLKVPILTGEGRTKETGPTQFISFGQDATQVQLPELLKRYSEQVCAAFGMNTSDLGLFGQEMRLAGMSKIIELSKRQGLARLLNQFERVINTDVLPEGLRFKWEDMELEDTVRREAAKKMSAERLAILANPMAPIISLDEARRQAAEEKLITVEGIDTPLDEAPPPEPPSGNGDKPKSDEGVTTSGDEKGAQAGARASPKGAAPHERGASTKKVPPRAHPANTPAAKHMGRIVGPWIKGIADVFTPARLGRLLDAGMKAWASMPEVQPARASPAFLRQKAAEDAIDAILSQEQWWHAPDLTSQIQGALAKGYEDTLVESAQEIQDSIYNAGLTNIATIGFASAHLTDPGTLASLKAQCGSMIRNVDEGTKAFVKRVVTAGVKEGMGSKAIARQVLVNNVRRGVIETFRGRALSIVNTEMNKAMTSATLAQQKSVGLTKKVWHAVAELACDICIDNASLGAVDGDYLFDDVFGGGCMGPPAHPTVCNCWISFDHADLEAAAGVAGGEPNYWQGGSLTEEGLPEALQGAVSAEGMTPRLANIMEQTIADNPQLMEHGTQFWVTPDGQALLDPTIGDLKAKGKGISIHSHGSTRGHFEPPAQWETFSKGDITAWRTRMIDGYSQPMMVIFNPNGEADVISITKATARTDKFLTARNIGAKWDAAIKAREAEWTMGGPTPYQFTRLGVQDFAFEYDLDVQTLVRWKGVPAVAPIAPPPLSALPISEWTEVNYRGAFEARFGHQLVEIGEDPGWTLGRARSVAETIETMPRCPDIAMAGGPKPLKFRMRTAGQIEADFPSYGAYYDPGTHEVVLPSRLFPGGEREFMVSTFADPGANVPLSWEFTAHEYGHALGQGTYGGWLPQGGQWAKMTRLSDLYEKKMAEIAAKGGEVKHWQGIMPSSYSMKNAGEMLAESIAYARINPVRFKQMYPEIVKELRHYFSWLPA